MEEYKGKEFDPNFIEKQVFQENGGDATFTECEHLKENDLSFVFRADWVACVTIAVIGSIFIACSFYFYKNRKKVSFMTRSPLTVSISLILLGCDCALNTLIYSGIKVGNVFHFQCNLGVVTTVVGQFGFMFMTSLRIYRISKVYNTY